MVFELEGDYYQITTVDKNFIQKQKSEITKCVFQNEGTLKQLNNLLQKMMMNL